MGDLLTIGIIYYRKPFSLRRCINSIFKFTKIPYKILLCCQGAPISRRAREYLLELEKNKKVEVVYFEENKGMGFGKKFLAENFETPYLYMMDDDIEVTEGWLGPLIEAMENYEDIGAVASIPLLYGVRPPVIGVRLEIKGGRLIRRPFTKEEKNTEKLGDGLIPSDGLTSGCCLFRHEIFRDAMFDPNLFIGTGGTVGIDFWLQVKKSKWKAAFSEKSGVIHRPWLCSIREYVDRRKLRVSKNPEAVRYLMEKHGLSEIVVIKRPQPTNLTVRLKSAIDLFKGTLMTCFPLSANL